MRRVAPGCRVSYWGTSAWYMADIALEKRSRISRSSSRHCGRKRKEWCTHGSMAQPCWHIDSGCPEHLRAATPLETQSYDIVKDMGAINEKIMKGSRYVDFGVAPSVEELCAGDHMQIDDSPEEPPPRSYGSSSSSSWQRPRPQPYDIPQPRPWQREEPKVVQAPSGLAP